ncbi:MAG: hypothetical protein JJE17_12015 [Peptostreptococcaceae bacterium]|nr:hypothetical protein [Peptostreptococcaceae bacterium]
MNLYIIHFGIFGILCIALGCLYLTRRKMIISLQYYAIFAETMFFSQLPINPIWTDRQLLIIAAVYFLFVIFSYIILKGRYEITNIKKGTLMPIITNLLDEKEIVYEVIDNSVVLTNYDNKEIKCKVRLISGEINLRGIIKLPFYDDLKDSLIFNVKLIKETVFPIGGVLLIITGILLIVYAMLIASSII